MNPAWGVLMSAIGALFFFWGRTQSNNGAYRILVARARELWGDRVHGMFQVAGVIMILIGIAMVIKR